MLYSLLQIQVAFIFAQLISLIFIERNCGYCNNVDSSLIYLLSFTLIILLFIFQYFNFSKIEKRNSEIYLSKLKMYILLAFQGSLWIVVILFSVDGYGGIMGLKIMLAEGVNNIGIVYKISSVILPAVSFFLLKTNLNKRFSYTCLAVSFMISSFSAIVFLSKHPIVPYIVFALAMYNKNLLNKKYIIYMAVIMIFSWLTIYVFRTNIDIFDTNELVNMMLFRVPSFIELSQIILWIFEGGSLHPDANIWTYQEIVSTSIMGASSNTGIALTYLGLFILFFGFFGIVLGFFSVYIMGIFMKKLWSDNSMLSVILYYLWAIEFLLLLLDGNPSFYISTVNAKMFYMLCSLTLVHLFLRMVFNKNQYQYQCN
jgi:hypothetical protein